MGVRCLPLDVQNAIVKRLTDRAINVGIEASQILYLILDALDSRSGFSASVAEMIYLVRNLLVRTV